MTTSAPAWASSRAQPRPMPRAAPVTKAIFRRRFMVVSVTKGHLLSIIKIE